MTTREKLENIEAMNKRNRERISEYIEAMAKEKARCETMARNA